MKLIIINVLLLVSTMSFGQTINKKEVKKYICKEKEFDFNKLKVKSIEILQECDDQKKCLTLNFKDFDSICFTDTDLIKEISSIQSNSSDSISADIISIQEFRFDMDTLYDVVVDIFNKAPSSYESFYHFIFSKNKTLLFKAKIFTKKTDFLGDYNADGILDLLVINWEIEIGYLFSYIGGKFILNDSYQLGLSFSENGFYPRINKEMTKIIWH